MSVVNELATSQKGLGTLKNLNFFRKIGFKLVIAIIASQIISTPLAGYINSQVEKTGLFAAGIGVYILSFMNIIVTTLIIFIFFRTLIIKPLKTQLEVIEVVSTGDLTRQVKIKGNNEFAHLAHAINIMIMRQREFIDKVKKITANVDNVSNNLGTTMDEIVKSSQDIASVIKNISGGSQEQNRAMTEAAQKQEELNAIIETASQKADQAKIISENTLHAINNGKDAVKETKEKMQHISSSANVVNNTVNELKEQSDKIGVITEKITSVSEQTNLLALNAAIEAARAGEHGKGFAVVAEEIRNLAEESQGATEEINSIIEGIKDKIDKAVLHMNLGNEAAAEGSKVVVKTEESLEEIINTVNQVVKQIEEINSYSGYQVKNSQKTIELINSIADISQNNSSTTQEIAASAQEQAASVQEVTASAKKLSQASTELYKHIRPYKTQ